MESLCPEQVSYNHIDETKARSRAGVRLVFSILPTFAYFTSSKMRVCVPRCATMDSSGMHKASPMQVDRATVATIDGALPVGTRIDVQWTHPTRWEPGVITDHDMYLERGQAVVYYKMRYDDGHVTVEDLRYVIAQTTSVGALVGTDGRLPSARKPRRSAAVHTSSQTAKGLQSTKTEAVASAPASHPEATAAPPKSAATPADEADSQSVAEPQLSSEVVSPSMEVLQEAAVAAAPAPVNSAEIESDNENVLVVEAESDDDEDGEVEVEVHFDTEPNEIEVEVEVEVEVDLDTDSNPGEEESTKPSRGAHAPSYVPDSAGVSHGCAAAPARPGGRDASATTSPSRKQRKPGRKSALVTKLRAEAAAQRAKTERLAVSALGFTPFPVVVPLECLTASEHAPMAPGRPCNTQALRRSILGSRSSTSEAVAAAEAFLALATAGTPAAASASVATAGAPPPSPARRGHLPSAAALSLGAPVQGAPHKSPQVSHAAAAPTAAAAVIRRVRCGECEACTRLVDCGECGSCLDKPKFGGPGTQKQACKLRKCLQLKVAALRQPAPGSSARSLDDVSFVQCDLCDQWRVCDGDPDQLPDQWTCEHDPRFGRCSAPNSAEEAELVARDAARGSGYMYAETSTLLDPLVFRRVWAKQPGFRRWPARVVPPVALGVPCPRAGYHLVRFYGCKQRRGGELSWLPSSALTPFDENDDAIDFPGAAYEDGAAAGGGESTPARGASRAKRHKGARHSKGSHGSKGTADEVHYQRALAEARADVDGPPELPLAAAGDGQPQEQATQSAAVSTGAAVNVPASGSMGTEVEELSTVSAGAVMDTPAVTSTTMASGSTVGATEHALLDTRTAVAASAVIRRVRCGECEACTRLVDCGECGSCLDKPKFGGPGTQKQACKLRKCLQLKVAALRQPAPGSSARSLDDVSFVQCDLCDQWRVCDGDPDQLPDQWTCEHDPRFGRCSAPNSAEEAELVARDAARGSGYMYAETSTLLDPLVFRRVWAKQPGFRRWPARVVPPVALGVPCPRAGYHLVRFYGCKQRRGGELSWLPSSALTPFDENDDAIDFPGAAYEDGAAAGGGESTPARGASRAKRHKGARHSKGSHGSKGTADEVHYQRALAEARADVDGPPEPDVPLALTPPPAAGPGVRR